MKRIQLSPDFHLDEFTRSETATRHGIPVDIPLGTDLHRNVRCLCVDLLQPMRSALGRAVLILSGYRPTDLNNLVGGAIGSRHILALAADVSVVGLSPLEVCRWYEQSDLPFDQVIHEFGRWTHIGAAPEKEEPRRQLLTAHRDPRSGATVYVRGLHDIQELLA